MISSLQELPYMRLLPSETTSVVSKLELIARGKMQGSMSGRHTSPNKGFSVIFAEHRPYSPGDDIRDLDWRVLGKSYRYYIKQYIEETNLRATILFDASGSMSYRGEAAAPVAGKPASKFEFAQFLAAGLAYLLVRQQDAVEILARQREQTHAVVRARADVDQQEVSAGEDRRARTRALLRRQRRAGAAQHDVQRAVALPRGVVRRSGAALGRALDQAGLDALASERYEGGQGQQEKGAKRAPGIFHGW